jgi:acetyl-CoA carboxylase carboxyltransferase component
MASEYAPEHLLAESAAAAGFVDEIIDPADTRRRLAAALDTLAGGHVASGGGCE